MGHFWDTLLQMNHVTVPGKFLGIVGQDPSDFTSNRLHVDIFRFLFIHLRHVLLIPLNWSAIFLESRTSTGYFLNSTGSSVTNRQFSSSPGMSHKYAFVCLSDI